MATTTRSRPWAWPVTRSRGGKTRRRSSRTSSRCTALLRARLPQVPRVLRRSQLQIAQDRRLGRAVSAVERDGALIARILDVVHPVAVDLRVLTALGEAHAVFGDGE